MSEFPPEYGPEDKYEPDQLENWNWIWTTVAVVIFITAIAGYVFYNQKQEEISDVGCHLYLDTVSTDHGWTGKYSHEDCQVIRAGMQKPMLKIAKTKQESDLIVCIVAGAGLYSFYRSTGDQAVNVPANVADQLNKSCSMFLFGLAADNQLH